MSKFRRGLLIGKKKDEIKWDLVYSLDSISRTSGSNLWVNAYGTLIDHPLGKLVKIEFDWDISDSPTQETSYKLQGWTNSFGYPVLVEFKESDTFHKTGHYEGTFIIYGTSGEIRINGGSIGNRTLTNIKCYMTEDISPDTVFVLEGEHNEYTDNTDTVSYGVPIRDLIYGEKYWYHGTVAITVTEADNDSNAVCRAFASSYTNYTSLGTRTINLNASYTLNFDKDVTYSVNEPSPSALFAINSTGNVGSQSAKGKATWAFKDVIVVRRDT